jgi:hypothetical protein
MQPDTESIHGLVFTHPETGEQYGTICTCESPQDHPATRTEWAAVAEDDCGNAFVVSRDGRVAFWDHETDEITELAPNWASFAERCTILKPVELDPSQVKSVWIDPAFAKEHGIDVPKDGWKKEP